MLAAIQEKTKNVFELCRGESKVKGTRIGACTESRTIRNWRTFVRPV